MSSHAELQAAVYAIKNKIDTEVRPTLHGVDDSLRETVELAMATLTDQGGNLNSAGTEVLGLLGDYPDAAQGLLAEVGARLAQADEQLDAYLARIS